MTEAVQAAPIANDVPDTAIKVYANKWVATIIVGHEPDPDGFFHISVATVGATKVDALDAAEYVLSAYATGRVAFIRVKPVAESHRNYITKETTHHGHVRFSYQLKAGVWSYPDQSIPKLFGEF